jgi:Family of unknown function (DUF5924)/Protein of unknown function (DUF2914)
MAGLHRRWLWRALQRAIPWISLAIGIVGALLMDRGPARGAIVAAVAVGSWLVLSVVMWLERKHEHQDAEGGATNVVRTARFSALMLTQSSIHLQLYFALPFYFNAFAGTFPHVVFMALMCGAALASLWDPLTEWLLVRTRAGVLLPAFSTFCVLAAVLPGLGLGNGTALWCAAAAAGLGLPVMVFADRLHGRPLARALFVALLVGLLFPAGLLLGGARMVPAVPMGLVEAAIGTRRVGHEVADPIDRLDRAPTRLVCATAIFAPLGVRDHLLHVWRKDGVVTDRIELEIRGGREDGFRTYSVKRNFGDDPNGTWSCAVETESGQFLGERTIVIASP